MLVKPASNSVILPIPDREASKRCKLWTASAICFVTSVTLFSGSTVYNRGHTEITLIVLGILSMLGAVIAAALSPPRRVREFFLNV